MSLFAVTYTYVRTPEALDAVRPAHLSTSTAWATRA